MHVDIAKKLFTVDEYYRMGEAGILAWARTIASRTATTRSIKKNSQS